MTIQLILFDIDGTLLLPKGVGRESTRLAMREVFGTEAALDQHHFGGKTDWYTLHELLSEQGYTEDRIGQMMPVYERALVRHLEQIIGGFLVEACPGALAAVSELRQRGLLLGVITGNVSTTAPVKLRAAGFDPTWFPIGAYGSEAADRNSLPFLALERAQRYCQRELTPEQVVIVGDTPADVACARALGAIAVAVRTGFSSQETLEATAPDYLLADLSEFCETVLNSTRTSQQL
ncbi:MAG TPA: HAD family hydrolase [Phototrophicaceae bacterium]|nr:HAD family hydrolase [Phototrophicaceae bacterium]